MTKTKPAKPPPASDTELPEGWISVRAGDVCEINPRKPNADVLPADELVTFLPMAAVDDYSGTIAAPEFRTFGELRPKSYTPFAEGDVLLAKITPCMENGKAALARGLRNKLGFGSTEFHVFRSTGAILPEYLYHYIRQQAFRDAAQVHMTGSAGQLRVPVEYVRALELPLAPLAEQKRIVGKVEELLERVNAARARLAKVPAILKRFRQSVLAAACSGRLTAEWRETHSTTAVADRITSLYRDRKTLFERVAQVRGKSRQPKYKPPFEPTPPDGVDIPHQWSWATVSQLCLQDVGYAFPSSGFAPDGVRLLRGENVEPGRLRWIDTKYWPADSLAGLEHLMINEGDLILAMDRPVISSGLKLARAVRDDLPCVLVQRVTRFRMVEEETTPYLQYCLLRKAFLDFLTQDGMTGSDLPHITGTGVAEYTIPLPPIEEQREIVRRVEALFAHADQIKGHVRAATIRAERLPQSVLARAFRGELVLAEAQLAAEEGREYEAASALLERIQELRKQQKPAKGGRGGKKMTKRSGRLAAKNRRPLAEVLREQGKPLTPKRLFDLAGFDEDTVDEFYEQLRGLIEAGTVRERRPNRKDVTLEAVGA